MSAYFPQLAESFGALLQEAEGQSLYVIGHGRPDGDCIGSQVALTGLLRAKGYEAKAVNADPVPRALSFLLRGEIDVDDVNEAVESSGPLVYVDCADELRVGPKTSQRLSNHRRLANIDHHISNTNFADINLVDATSAASCEIIAGLAYDFEIPIDRQVAQNLYTGIMTDTGRFGYAATTSRVFELCSRLVNDGASPNEAHQALFENEPMGRLKLLQRFLSSLKLELGNRVCVGELRQEDFRETGTSYEDTEGFVDYARSVAEAEVGVLIEERKTTTKCSLRGSDSSLRLDKVAAQFGGGGHSRAAAMNTEISFDELRRELLLALQKRLSESDD